MLTCIPERKHHNPGDEDVDTECCRHLNVGGPEPPPELLDVMLPPVPVFVGGGKLDVFNEVYYLVNYVSLAPELLRCEDLD